MDKNTLARANDLFFNVDLPMRCLFTETFLELCSRAHLVVAYHEKYHSDIGDCGCRDEITQIPFKCQSGEFGYLRFTHSTASLLVERLIRPLSLATKIRTSVKGEFNERCEFNLNDGISVSFSIINYEGDLGHGCIEITNPVVDCPTGDIPLGRKVEMNVICATAAVPLVESGCKA